MQKAVNVTLVVAVSLWPLLCCGQEGPVAWWSFDQDREGSATDVIGGTSDPINGNYAYKAGVAGKSLQLDGYTTFVRRAAAKVPALSRALTVEAWIAPQTYSWNWTGVLSQAGDVVKKKQQPGELVLEPGLFGVKYSESDFTNPEGTDILTSVNHDWTGGYHDWAARWRGYIEGPFTGPVNFTAEADNGLKLEIDGKVVIDGLGRNKERSGVIKMVKGRRYPIVLSYYQDGDPSYLRLYWSWEGQDKTLVQGSALKHSKADVEYVASKEMNRGGPPPERKDRIFFGIDHEGHIGMKLMLGGQLKECVSDVRIPLLKWSHIAGTFDSREGIKLYVNGKVVGSLATEGVLSPPAGQDLLIGRSQKRMSPANTERRPSRKTLSYMVFDGLIDEVKLYDRCLSAEQVGRLYAAGKPANDQPLRWRRMPAGPEKVNSKFGGCYCRLRYDQPWERLWRVGPDPDILVVFDESPVRLVFWRGTSYGAAWVTENGKWMGDQSLEATGNSTGMGCAEHMSDKQCRYSHVKLIENHDARVVVHWHYAISDIKYNISREDADGWGEWADEYYYIYPDAVSTRKQVLHSTVLKHEWQETIALNQPGTRPEDNLELDALTWANMDGESITYSWKTEPSDDAPRPKEPTIQLVNMKSQYRPFIIYPPQNNLNFFTCCVEEQWSHFPWWNHWPVGQIPNDGRRTGVPDRPSHSSLSQGLEDSPAIEHDPQKGTYTAVHLIGMTDGRIEELVPLARSWNRPAKLQPTNAGFSSRGYDRYERAYILDCKKESKPDKLEFVLAASVDSPVVNPAFVVNNWGEGGVRLEVDGRQVKRGRSFRVGHRHRLDGSDLVVWVKMQATQPVRICLESDGH